MSDKYHQPIEASTVVTNDEAVTAAVTKILADHADENRNADVYRRIFNCIDLTTLATTDSPASVSDFVERVNIFEDEHPDLPNVAAICVYPNFAQIVRTVLDVSDVKVACVAGGFPSAQTFPEIKVAETAMAVQTGADEIDMVFQVGLYLDGDYEGVTDDIAEIKAACGNAHLKVILETGALKTAEHIRNASILSMYSGADFIKTSTGKVYEGASLEAAFVMAQCIKEYYEKTGRRVGFKASGGVVTTDEAVQYYTIIKEILGEEWLNNDLFRIGASRLANNLLSDIIGDQVKHF